MGNKHLVIQKDFIYPPFKNCRCLMFVMAKGFLMVCQKCGYMCSIEFDVTSKRRSETFN